MTPYYDEDGVTIYHGDCLSLVDVWNIAGGVMVTDPPYGMGYSSGWTREVWSGGAYGDAADGSIEGDDDTTARDRVLEVWNGRPALVFGRFGIAPPIGTKMALVWDKGMSAGMGDLSVPWRPNWELIFVVGAGFLGRRDSGVIHGHHNISRVSMGRVHPHMKPVGLLRELLTKTPPLADIVDPFMGSGTTLRAAKDLGRRAVGIELDERYCEVAAKRLAQGVLFGEAS